MNPVFGINIVGYLSSNVSLGITARHFTRLLIEKGVPVSIYDINYNRAPNAISSDFQSLTIPRGEDLPYNVNLLFVANWQLSELLLWRSQEIFKSGRLNAGVIWHEPTHLPPRYRKSLACLDVLITASEFVHEICQTQISDTLILGSKHPLYLPANVQPNRTHFGLPDHPVLFVQSFDPHSDPARKNPYGAIDAFRLAARELGDKAHLVVKVNNVEVKGPGCDPDAIIQKIRRHCDNDPRIHIIAQSLPYNEVLSLYASCDVFISLHRAEGLGLGLLESMALGKPVIATAWSGNMSFMRHTNSCLVGYDLVPFSGIGADSRDKLGKYSVWAEPHVDEAADWIKILVGDESLRFRIGKQAAADAAEYQVQATRGDFIDELKALVLEKEFIQRRKDDKWRRIDGVRTEFEKYHFDPATRAHKKAVRLFDRLIGWRFR